MQLRMWMHDLAREQAPTLDHLRILLNTTREAGFNAFGLYMEHRFAYPSTPWSHGKGCVTPEMVRTLIREDPDIQIIPFVNLLGHFEGMLYTEEGKRYREELFSGMQACPSSAEFVALAERLVDDVLKVFDSEIVHIGGDETWQLGACPRCRERVEEAEKRGDGEAGSRGDGETEIRPGDLHPPAPLPLQQHEPSVAREGGSPGPDGKAELYGAHFGPLAERVVRAGRRPAVWGDMFLDHPTALAHMPPQTLIFDWQYFKGAESTSRMFREKGFDVVCSPTLHTYNATWLHVAQSEENVRQHVRDAAAVDAHGVCVTTWENGLFGAYDTLLPALRACGGILQGRNESFLQAYLQESERYEEWARLMGVELQSAGGTFAFGGIRSSLKVRLLLNGNPFLAWLHHGEELSGEVGDKALDIIDRALAVAPSEATKGVTLFARGAIEFVRLAEAARQEYAGRKPEAAILKLAPTRALFEDLERIARRTHERIGGSLADIERCRIAREHVERVIQRIRRYGDGSLGYLPAYEHLTHHKFVPHDQGAWWLINRWANQ